MDIGNDHREIRKQHEFQWFTNDAAAHQELIEDAVSSEKRDPRDHADDVRGPERHRAQQEKTDLPKQAANVENQEIRHVRSLLWQIGLFLLCTVPFWTSN